MVQRHSLLPARETGYHIVFQSAIAGVVLFVVARTLAVLANAFIPTLGECWHTIVPLDYSGTAAGAFLLAGTLPWVLNWLPPFKKLKARKKAAEAAADHVSLIIDQAMLESHFVEISLANGKSYVGAPIQGTFGHRDGGDVALIPIISGYRDKDSRELVMTTNYATALESRLSDLELDNLKVAFPMRDIVSARLFDQELFEAFQDARTAAS